MKKIISIISALTILAAMTACGEKNKPSNIENGEQYNKWGEVMMNDGLLFYGQNSDAMILDYETMEGDVLCNIPNCSHLTSECLVNVLHSQQQLPVIYNNCAYYFINSSDFADGKDGKRILELKYMIMKYDFNKMEISKVAQIDDYNADCDGSGGYLIGAEYYFMTNNGDPDYDDAGNVNGSSNSGQVKMFSINLDTEEIIDYGEFFDYEAHKKKYPDDSIYSLLVGKSDNKLYICIDFGRNGICTSQLYSFNIDTKEIEKISDKISRGVGDGYIAYISENGEDIIDSTMIGESQITIENIETGELTEGPDILYYNTMTTCNNKLWYDTKCYDFETKKEVELADFSDCDFARAVGIYENDYIIQSEKEGKLSFTKVPVKEIDKLFK